MSSLHVFACPHAARQHLTGPTAHHCMYLPAHIGSPRHPCACPLQGPVFSSQHLDPRQSAPGQPLVGTIPMPPNFGGSGEGAIATSSPAQSLVGNISMHQFEQVETPATGATGASGASWGNAMRGTSPHATSSRDPYSSIRPLLRQRSDAPLEGVEMGPLLGRGSYGRVFKVRDQFPLHCCSLPVRLPWRIGHGACFTVLVLPACCRHPTRPAGSMFVHCCTDAQVSGCDRSESLALEAPPALIWLPMLTNVPAYHSRLIAMLIIGRSLQSQGRRFLLCLASAPHGQPCYVLQGRWKGAIVAIKVIDHRLKGNDMGMDIQRESMLSTSIVHPNVVSCQPADLQPGQPAPCNRSCARQPLACGGNANPPVCVCAVAWQLLAPGNRAGRCQQAAPSWQGAATQPACFHRRQLLFLSSGAAR